MRITTKQHRRAWFNQARIFLKKYLKNKALNWQGEPVTTLNDVYTIVLEMNVNSGRALARNENSAPSLEQIELIRQLFPGIDEEMQKMTDKPVEFQLEDAQKRIAELEKENRQLEESNRRLIAALPSQHPGPDPAENREMVRELVKELALLRAKVAELERVKKPNGV